MIDLGVLLGSYQLTRIVGELTGVMDSIGVKIDRLASSELDAALRSLYQAQQSSGERVSLLRAARGHLNQAISLETGERLVAAYLALAVTHTQLSDTTNATDTLREFIATNFMPKTRAISGSVNIAFFGLQKLSSQLIRQHRIEEIKQAVRVYLESHE
jgi:hypothetical protein